MAGRLSLMVRFSRWMSPATLGLAVGIFPTSFHNTHSVDAKYLLIVEPLLAEVAFAEAFDVIRWELWFWLGFLIAS